MINFKKDRVLGYPPLAALCTLLILPLSLRNQEIESALAIFLGVAAVQTRIWNSIFFSMILVFTALAVCATLYQSDIDQSFDWWQALRSGAPFAMFLVSFEIGRRSAVFDVKQRSMPCLLALSAGLIVHLALGRLEFPISQYANFRSMSGYGGTDLRQYSVCLLFLFPLLWYYLKSAKWLPCILLSIPIIFSGSRGLIGLMLIYALLGIVWQKRTSQSSDQLYLLRRVMAVCCVLLLGAFAVNSYSARFSETGSATDSNRLREYNESWKAFSETLVSTLIGRGFGVPYTIGYYEHLTIGAEAHRQHENSRFDVHNSFLSVLLRCGTIGGVVFFYYCSRVAKDTGNGLAFWLYILFVGATSHALVQTFESSFALFVWGYLAETKFRSAHPA